MALQDIDVTAINLFRRQALITDGSIANITRLFDADGDETDDMELAMAFMAHHVESERWLTGSVSDFIHSSRVH